MSDFPPNSGYPAPQGPPLIPQGGAYPQPQPPYQAPQTPYVEHPKNPTSKGPIIAWIAVVTVLALTLVLFLWRTSSHGASPSPTPSAPDPSSSSSVTPNPNPSQSVDDGIDEETISGSRGACWSKATQSRKVDAINEIKTKSVHYKGQYGNGDTKYTYTGTLTGYAKGSSTKSNFEVVCSVVHAQSSNTFNVLGKVSLTRLTDPSQSSSPAPTPTRKFHDDDIDEKTWMIIFEKCSNASPQSLRDDYKVMAVSIDYLKKTATLSNGDEEYELTGKVQAERKNKEDTDFSSSLLQMKCTATHVKTDDSYDVKAEIDPNPIQ